MAVTPGRLEDPTKHSFFNTDEATPETPAGVRDGTLPSERRTGEDARRGWSRGLLGLWTVIMLSVLFEPAPNPHATVPLWAGVLGFLFYTGFFTTIWGLAGNHPWGLKASLVTAGLGLGMAAACAVTDHHPLFWWGYEMVAMGTLFGFSRLASSKTSS
ncbi:MAG: hypothetical protein M3P01_13800 [Actinomycetota bacterium]|nr:hypothetical protein [Actinomycetota bacterium]